MTAGRPPILQREITYRDADNVEQTTTVSQAIVNAISVGVPRKHAAQAAGVSEGAVMQWLKDGRDLSARIAAGIAKVDDLTDNERLYLDFAEAVQKADGQAVSFNVAIIRQATGKHWQAAAWWLERRYPNLFARRIEVDSEPGDRDPAPLDAPTAAEVEEAFDTAHVPDGIEASDVLPNIGGDDA